MNYNFDEIIDRSGTNSLKWEVAEGELPMWVADMDFATAPEVREAIVKRAEHGIFGYSVIPEEWNAAYVNWWKKRHGFAMEPDWLIFCTGVIPAISSIVRKLTTPGEKVLVQTPVYNIFFNSVVNNGRFLCDCPLTEQDGQYDVDWEALEKALADPQVSLMILCNPHNPVGRIWKREELARLGSLCKKYHVVVVSDEIHCELTDPGTSYVPFASASEECRDISITCFSPSKAFNLAGMQSAAVCVPDPLIRHRVWRGLNTDEVAEPNAFAVQAAVAAYTQGEKWLEECRSYIAGNRQLVADFVKQELPQVTYASGPATYLCWLDCRRVPGFGEGAAGRIRQQTGLYVTDGVHYGKSGAGYLRMNVACPRSMVSDGLARLKRGLELL